MAAAGSGKGDKKGCRKMLVAVNGSAAGTHALREAFRLAAHEKSWITVVSVAPPYEGDLDMVGIGAIQQAVRQPCERALAEAAAAARAARVLVKTVCEEGEPHKRIVELAEAENSDLIVVGRREARGAERVFMGSVTARVIGYSRQDVLVVPYGAEVEWSAILLATDGSAHSSGAAEKAVGLARAYGGTLIAVSVVDVPPELYGEAPQALEELIGKARGYAAEAAAQAEAAGVSACTLVREGEAHRVLIDLAREMKASVIVVGSHGRTGVRKFLMGSVTEKVVAHAGCPVFVARLS